MGKSYDMERHSSCREIKAGKKMFKAIFVRLKKTYFSAHLLLLETWELRDTHGTQASLSQKISNTQKGCLNDYRHQQN